MQNDFTHRVVQIYQSQLQGGGVTLGGQLRTILYGGNCNRSLRRSSKAHREKSRYPPYGYLFIVAGATGTTDISSDRNPNALFIFYTLDGHFFVTCSADAYDTAGGRHAAEGSTGWFSLDVGRTRICTSRPCSTCRRSSLARR